MRDYTVTITNNTIQYMYISKNSTIDDTIFQNGRIHRLVKKTLQSTF